MLLRATTVRCAAGKGFGDASQPRKSAGKGGKQRKDAPGVKSGDSKAVERAVQLVEEHEEREQQRATPAAARPVDPREAARGKVEFVRVKDWGSGKPEDLGGLQVDEATTAFEAGSGGMPFHEALARRLEVLQSQGALSVAQPRGGKPLPAFALWAFAEEDYVQYLADLLAVHEASEGSLAQAAAAQVAAAAAATPAEQPRHELLLRALRLFGPDAGLARAAALRQDLASIAARQQQQQADGAAAGGSGGGGGGGAAPPPPTQHAAAYASYVASLARLVGSAESTEEAEQAVLRLLAHTYVVLLMHLTSGGRIAGAAGDKLALGAIDALAFHKSYPALPEGTKPLDAFVAATNQLGAALDEEQQEALMGELAKAMTKGSLLLVPLARER